MRGTRAIFLVALLAPALVGAEPLARGDVPEPLVPWVDWVLRDAPEAACPFAHGEKKHRQCHWPSRLDLVLTEKGGRFEQEWRLYREDWVPLPGDAKLWPHKVRSGKRRVPVVERGAVPMVRLGAGRHRLVGSFRWSELPEHLPVPAETGLVSLTIRGAAVRYPERDLGGRLWLQRRAEQVKEGSRIDVVVHRRVIDEVPLQLVTSIELKVAGRNREEWLGPVLPDGFVPMRLSSPLPVRIEPDGRLRVQVRPGTFRLQLDARHRGGPVAEIGPPARDAGGAAWDDDEVWVFDARPALRLVNVEGASPVDPQQTTLPGDWRGLPAYLMAAGSVMKLVERRRGDDDPAPDQLALSRTWWLDFDGGGYTVHDEITGALRRSWRLEAAAPLRLGRVAINGSDQFISRLDDSDRFGVEVRQGQARIDADSRIDGVRSPVPAVGWSHDFQKVSGQLNLPPGWRLLHASGVDDVRSTWITRWTLLEIFLVLVTAAATFQLRGMVWGAVALVTLALIYPESGAPRWSWLALLAALALLRVIPEGRLRRLTQAGHLVTIVVLALVAIPFAVQQARIALHPALELPQLAVRGDETQQTGFAQAKSEEQFEMSSARTLESDALGSPAFPKSVAPRRGRLFKHYVPDPQARVSTGPGLPHWGWRAVALHWRGPVQAEQPLRLVLLPPWGSSLVAGLRVALTALFALCLIDTAGRAWRRFGGGRTAGAALVALVLAGGAPSRAAADLPPEELLDELRSRLVEPPACFPECASSPRLRVDATPTTLRLRLEIDVGAATAVPLPGGGKSWTPATVLVDGAPAVSLAHSPDGRLWVSLEPGHHQLVLAGPLPARDSVQLPLPLKPHHVEARVDGWRLEGVRDDGESAQSLELTRERDVKGVASSRLEPQELPPFVRVERTLELGLSWQVTTRVLRLTPTGRAVFLEVPLLAGESVTSETVRVEDGRALVELPAGSKSLSWTSVLSEAESLVLEAPDDTAWTEVWKVDAAPLWHVEPAGFPTLHSAVTPEIRVREWQPWPGERLELSITRPGAADGRTLTLDRTRIQVRPGLRASEVTLFLSLRASRGAEHTVVLPAGAELDSVKIDDALLPIRAVDGEVTFPVRPGSHRATIAWRSPDPIRATYRTPLVQPGAPSVNNEIEIQVPRDRWVLRVAGPRLGPAVLFWSALVVVALIAFALGRLPFTPLGWGSWFLLFLGMTQVPIYLSAVVAGWLLALGWRRDHGADGTPLAFDALQLLLVAWTGFAFVALIWAVQTGLLGMPEMQIAGNGSSGTVLRWYSDRSADVLPTAMMFSAPMLLYRLAMLAWALWLAWALIRWLRWGWECFSTAGLWRPINLRVQPQREKPL